MSQANDSSTRSALLWAMLPFRLFLHGLRYMFGHPMPFMVALSVLALLLFYLSALPGPPAEDGRVTIGEGAPFPGTSTIASVLAMLVGILIIWVSQHAEHANTVWTRAPSIWRPPGQPINVSPTDESEA